MPFVVWIPSSNRYFVGFIVPRCKNFGLLAFGLKLPIHVPFCGVFWEYFPQMTSPIVLTPKRTVLGRKHVIWAITVWTVVQTVLTATFNSYGNRQISTPYKISTPEPIEKKFGTVDYVREGTPYTKSGTNPPTVGFWANGWNITKIIFIYLYLFSETGVQVRPVDGFLRAIAH